MSTRWVELGSTSGSLVNLGLERGRHGFLVEKLNGVAIGQVNLSSRTLLSPHGCHMVWSAPPNDTTQQLLHLCTVIFTVMYIDNHNFFP